jgi:hypothetical protein
VDAAGPDVYCLRYTRAAFDACGAAATEFAAEVRGRAGVARGVAVLQDEPNEIQDAFFRKFETESLR